MGRKEKENTESTENMDTQNGTDTRDETAGVQSEVNAENQSEETADAADAEKKYNELNDKYLRLYSDFDNFRKRTIKEKADLISSASADVLKDLLVILDDFERATVNNENVEDPKVLRESFKLIQHKLILALTSKGLEAVESKGEIFDADKHEAITNIAVTDEKQKGKVVDVVERGYNLRGKTLRFAKVIVGQ